MQLKGKDGELFRPLTGILKTTLCLAVFEFVKQLILRNSKTLDTINLASFEWLTETSKLDFLGQCQELTEFKLTGGNTDYDKIQRGMEN